MIWDSSLGALIGTTAPWSRLPARIWHSLVPHVGTALIIALSAESGSPGRQIRDQISGLITTGQLGQGERLPSVRQLAADLGVAPGTVAKAYRSLEADGLLISRKGSGTRVSDRAAPVSLAVAQAARRLTGAAHREGLSLEQAVQVLRTTW